MLPAGRQAVRFGPFRLHGKTRTLTRGGTAIALGGRALDVLIALAGANGAPLSKGVLLDRVWPGVTVGENKSSGSGITASQSAG